MGIVRLLLWCPCCGGLPVAGFTHALKRRAIAGLLKDAARNSLLPVLPGPTRASDRPASHARRRGRMRALW